MTHRIVRVDPGRVDEIDQHFSAVGTAYEDVAFAGAGLRFVSDRELFAVRAALSDLPAGSRVLDVGAGTGRVSRVLSTELDLRVTAVDRSAEMAHALRARLDRAAVAQADAGRGLPFAAGTFDAVVTIRVLKWIPRWTVALAELARVVRSHGLVVIELTNRHSLARVGYMRAPVTTITLAELSHEAASVGLQLIHRSPGTRLPQVLWAAASTAKRASVLAGVERALDRLVGTTGARSVLCVFRRSERDKP